MRPLRMGGRGGGEGGRERLLEGGVCNGKDPPGTIGAHKGPPWDGACNETLGAGKAMGDPPDGGAGEGLWGTGGGQEGSVGGGERGRGGFTCTALTTPPRRELPDTAVGQTVRVLPALHAGLGMHVEVKDPDGKVSIGGLLWGSRGGVGGGVYRACPPPLPPFPPPLSGGAVEAVRLRGAASPSHRTRRASTRSACTPIPPAWLCLLEANW